MNGKTNHAARGFTLIELSISMGVTMILLAAAVAMFQNASNSNQAVTQSADMTGNLRVGLNLIEQDLQQAGTGIPLGGIPIPYTDNGAGCGVSPEPNRPTLTGPAPFRLCNSVLPAVEPGNALGPQVSVPDGINTVATDEVTVLYADNTIGLDAKPINQPATPGPPPVAGCNGNLTLNGGTLQVQFDPACVNLNNVDMQINVGDLIMFSNTLGNAILAVTNAAGTNVTFAPGDAFFLNGRAEASGTIKQLMTSSTCSGAPACFPPTLATRIWMISYYLDNISSPPYVRLIRQVNFNQPSPVGETLENLQFTYNFYDQVTNPANQPVVPVGNNEAQIRAVNVYLGARSTYQIANGKNSYYARNNLVSQISLRSMAYYNKYQ